MAALPARRKVSFADFRVDGALWCAISRKRSLRSVAALNRVVHRVGDPPDDSCSGNVMRRSGDFRQSWLDDVGLLITAANIISRILQSQGDPCCSSATNSSDVVGAQR